MPSLRRPSRARDAYHHGDLAETLVTEAMRAIETEGAASFSLRAVASRVGVSPTAAYRHFQDKDALLGAVIQRGFQELTQAMVTARNRAPVHIEPGDTAVEHLKAVGRAYVHFALARPALFACMLSNTALEPRAVDPPRTLKPTTDACEQEASPNSFGILSEALDALLDAGLLSDATREGAELKAWTVVHGYATLAQGGLTALHAKEPLEAVLDFVVRGLVTRTTPGRRRA